MSMRVHSNMARAAAVLALLIVLPLPTAEAQETVTLKAVMILASDKPAPIDRRLENIEYKLRRIFKFEHYRHYGRGSITLALPGSGSIRLGRGYELEINASKASDGKIRTKVKWRGKGKVLLSTTTVVRRRRPTVLGGVSHGDGKLIVTLVVD